MNEKKRKEKLRGKLHTSYGNKKHCRVTYHTNALKVGIALEIHGVKAMILDEGPSPLWSVSSTDGGITQNRTTAVSHVFVVFSFFACMQGWQIVLSGNYRPPPLVVDVRGFESR